MGWRPIVAFRPHNDKTESVECPVSQKSVPVMKAGNLKVSEIDSIVHMS